MPSSWRAADFDIAKIHFVHWGWDFNFGGSLTITAMYQQVGTFGRAYIAGDDPALDAFKAGRFVCVCMKNGAPAVAIDVDLCATDIARASFDESWARAVEHQAMATDATARFWCSIRGIIGDRGDSLKPQGQLSVGWADRYAFAIAKLYGHLELFKQDFTWPLGAKLPAPFEDWTEVLNRGRDLDVDAVLALVKRRHEFSFEKLLELRTANWHDAIHSVMGDHTPICDVTAMAIDAYLLSAEQTDSGRRVPLLRGRDLTYHAVRADAFPTGIAASFWKRIITLPVEWTSLVTATDIPADMTEKSDVVSAMPRAEDKDAAGEAAEALIDEALAERKWTIPPGALLELSFGPFTHVELYETPASVEFMLRTESGEFTAGGINLAKEDRRIWWEALTSEPDLAEARGPIAAGLFLMLAAAIRDFLVVEERERVFRNRPAPRKLQTANTNDGPRVVYLPRVSYVGRPDVEKCRKELDHRPREARAHAVRPHIRRAETASLAQIFIARRYGMEIPKGYTFVRPHERGRKARDVVYRSRSALQCLFQVTATTSPAGGARDAWFQFERDVHRLMALLGFDVEHVAASGRGDRGVDVYATKGADLDEVAWVVQCKAFGPRHKVGPHIVRELVGTLAEYPQGTRGMLVTTSSFTPDTIELARRHHIRLMDGEEFGRLLRERTGAS